MIAFCPNDCILFSKATGQNVTRLNLILDTNCNASGQRIHLDKYSVCFGRRCSGETRASIKGILHIPNETLAERYLGLPSDVGRSINGAFSYLKDRVWKNVQGWMEKCLAGSGNMVGSSFIPQKIHKAQIGSRIS